MLSATLSSELRLSLSDVQLALNISDPDQRSGVMAIPITSSWVVGSETNSVELVGFFDSGIAAMSDGTGHNIPADHVLGGLTEGGMLPFNGTSPGNGNAGRTFFQQPISRLNVSSSRTETLKIQTLPIADLDLPAGEYHGVLHLRLISY